MSEQFYDDSLTDDPSPGCGLYLCEASKAPNADWGEENLNSLRAAYRAFHHRPDDEAAFALRDVFQDFKEMGTVFGCPQVSKIGHRAIDFMNAGLPKSPQELELVHALVAAMELAVTERQSDVSTQDLLKDINKALRRIRRQR